MSWIVWEGVALTHEEALSLASVRETPAWEPLLRLLNQMRSDEVTTAMNPKGKPEDHQYARGAYGALSAVEAMLGKTLPEAVLAKMRDEAHDTDQEGA